MFKSSNGKSWLPDIGYLLTGLGENEANRDLKRLALIALSVPIGVAGFQFLRLYSTRNLLSGKPKGDIPETSITLDDYYKILQEEKEEAKKAPAAGMEKTSSLRLIERVLNVASYHPFLAAGVLSLPAISTYFAKSYLFDPIEDSYLKNEIEEAKRNYLKTLRSTYLLSKKILSGKLEERDILSIPEDIRSLTAKKLRARTGIDYSKELGLVSEDGQKEASFVTPFGREQLKRASVLSLVGSLMSTLAAPVTLSVAALRGAYAAPFISAASGFASAAQESPILSSGSIAKDVLSEWQSKAYPYMKSTMNVMPPEEFFQELEEIEARNKNRRMRKLQQEEADATTLEPDNEELEERSIVNKYIKQRLKQLEDDKIKETKTRGTKIISK